MAAPERSCPRCGAVLAGSRPEALCPRCLLEAGLGSSLTGESLHSDSRFTEWNGLRLPEPPAQLRYFGDYELVGELARGGMGIVYLARQTSLDRLVAVKLLLYGEFSSPAFVERFRTEAAAAARLQHPGIVGIHEIGEQDGQHFFSMEYVPGENLAQRVVRQPLPPREAAALLVEVADAVHFAHAQGILHRDLKPANVLVDRMGHARVTDFGLAKRLDRNSELTGTGEVLGSPCFMAPEQVLGDSERVGMAADVYGLGAILYHALTGRPPLQASTVAATLELVLRQDPVSPRRLNPSVPRDLETICLKCLAKSPTQRYATAAAVRDDLQRFLRDEPIQARPVTPPERLWRWARRRPAGAGLVVAGVLLIATLIGSGFLYGRQKEQARVKESALRGESERQRYAMSINLAERARTEGDFAQADKLLDGVVPRAGDVDLRGWEWYHLRHELRGQEERVIWSSTNEIHALAADAPGERLAVLLPQELRILAVTNGATLGVWPIHDESTGSRTLVFPPMGAGVVLGSLAGATQYEPGQPPRRLLTEPANILAFSGDGQRLAFSSVNLENSMDAPVGAGILNLATERVLYRQTTNGGPGLVWTRPAEGGEEVLYLMGSRGQLTRWQPGQVPQEIWGKTHFTDFAAFSRDGRRLVVDDLMGSFDAFQVTNVPLAANLEPVPIYRVPWSVTRALVALNFDGTRGLFKNGADKRVALCDTTTGGIIRRYLGHRGELTGLTFLGQSSSCVSASRDGTIRLWDTAQRSDHQIITNDLRSFGIPRPVASFDGSLISVVVDGAMPSVSSIFYDAKTSKSVAKYSGYSMAISPSSKEVLFWNGDNTYRRAFVVDISNSVELHWKHAPAEGRSVVTADGSLLLFRDKKNALYVSDIRIGSEPKMIAPDSSFPLVADSGNQFVAMVTNGVGLWNPMLGKLEIVLDKDAQAFRFSPDGKLLAAGDIEGSVTVIEIASKRALLTLPGHGGEVYTIAFSPDGKTLVSGAEDRMIRFWAIPSGSLLFSRALPENSHWLEFSGDSQLLIVGWVGAYELLSAPLEVGAVKKQPKNSLWSALFQ